MRPAAPASARSRNSMRRRILAAAAAAAMLPVAALAQAVSFDGWGPVRLGMTVAAAERALKARLKPMDKEATRDCWVTQRRDGKQRGVQYAVQNGRIARIDIYTQDGETPRVKDTRGLGIGSTEADIRRAYGEVAVLPAPYWDEEAARAAAETRAKLGIMVATEPPHYWIRVDSPDLKHGIIFETRDGKVLSFWTGFV